MNFAAYLSGNQTVSHNTPLIAPNQKTLSTDNQPVRHYTLVRKTKNINYVKIK